MQGPVAEQGGGSLLFSPRAWTMHILDQRHTAVALHDIHRLLEAFGLSIKNGDLLFKPLKTQIPQASYVRA